MLLLLLLLRLPDVVVVACAVVVVVVLVVVVVVVVDTINVDVSTFVSVLWHQLMMERLKSNCNDSHS